jgi:uncharacterized membrane protein
MDKIEPLAQLKVKFSPIENTNLVHQHHLSKLDRLALFITKKVGSMGFVFACVILVAIPIFFTSTISIVQYISSGILQLILLPLILVGQNLMGRHAELRAKHDFETNVKAEKEIETILLHLEKQDEMMLDILHRIERIEKQGKNMPKDKSPSSG